MRKPINILLVEDDQLDQHEVQRILDKKGILYRIRIAKNGEEGLRILRETNGQQGQERPDVILLDLNMPKMNGFEFLKELRSDVRFIDMRVFVLTTSDDKDDKAAARNFNVSGFITKPLKLESPSSIDAFNLMIDLMNL
ncbi:MAG TPA: response regulator [Cyclobacteriaceae bacterium]|nr:response regulator [Cyclobacteriaceae bacterium]